MADADEFLGFLSIGNNQELTEWLAANDHCLDGMQELAFEHSGEPGFIFFQGGEYCYVPAAQIDGADFLPPDLKAALTQRISEIDPACGVAVLFNQGGTARAGSPP